MEHLRVRVDGRHRPPERRRLPATFPVPQPASRRGGPVAGPRSARRISTVPAHSRAHDCPYAWAGPWPLRARHGERALARCLPGPRPPTAAGPVPSSAPSRTPSSARGRSSPRAAADRRRRPSAARRRHRTSGTPRGAAVQQRWTSWALLEDDEPTPGPWTCSTHGPSLRIEPVSDEPPTCSPCPSYRVGTLDPSHSVDGGSGVRGTTPAPSGRERGDERRQLLGLQRRQHPDDAAVGHGQHVGAVDRHICAIEQRSRDDEADGDLVGRRRPAAVPARGRARPGRRDRRRTPR